jgi:MoxR-like ATPase
MMRKTAHQYQYYGSQANAGEVLDFLRHALSANLRLESQGQRKTPVCIWGRHGIGKTEMVQDLAAELDYDFSYIAPAQFEEMGDLVGMPTIEGEQTVFRAPAWVPKTEGPGILLIDDVNRADLRILRGIMQLLQNYELVSWSLPAKWQIVLTANPDGGDYAVTPMDDAMLTRMMHITLEFDAKAWSRWAVRRGVDQRGIGFVLTYPEVVSGDRTTARSLVQFFDAIADIPDLRKQLPLVRHLGNACLDEETVAAFVAYVQQDLSQLISPEDICQAAPFSAVAKRLEEMVSKETLRVDILSTVTTRLMHYLTEHTGKLDQRSLDNVKAFLLLDFLPNDMRMMMAQDLMEGKQPGLQQLMADPELAMLLLDGM